jgi:hypothetical protein
MTMLAYLPERELLDGGYCLSLITPEPAEPEP